VLENLRRLPMQDRCVLSGVVQKIAARLLALVDRFIPGQAHHNPEELSRARILIGFAGLLATPGFGLAGGYLAAGYYVVGGAVTLGAVLVCVVPFLVRARGATGLAAHWLLGVFSSILVLVCIAMGGLDPYTIMWMPLVPLAAVLMSGGRASAIWTGIVCLQVTALFILRAAGIRFFETQQSPLILDLAGVWIILGMTFGFAVLYERMNKRSRAKLAEAMKTAQEANAAKSAFLANISHELRTPMNGVIGMSEALQATLLDEEQREHARTLQMCSETLLSLINDVLDFSKIEAKKLQLEEIVFSLKKNIQDTAAVFARQAEQKALELEVELDPRVPEEVCGDPTRLRQVLYNLLGNAIKFTERGSVRLSVELVRAETNAALIKIGVHDTGIGIPAEHHAHLFQPFSQADASTTRRFGGTGLGLAIARQIVEAMGGKIAVASTEGQGSTFELELMFRTAALPVAKPILSKSTGAEENRAILLVEDNPVNRKVAAQMLKRFGLRCDVAVTGKEAVEAVDARVYDLILMDIQMPVMDGYEATREIRKQELNRQQHVHIVAMTANAMDGDRERCLAAGMDDYLSKPITSARLGEVLATARLRRD
jgi:signal transduction histidine kinase/CheY-like chemotaxis protein